MQLVHYYCMRVGPVYAQELGGVWQLKHIGSMACAMHKVSLLQCHSYEPGSAVVFAYHTPCACLIRAQVMGSIYVDLLRNLASIARLYMPKGKIARI